MSAPKRYLDAFARLLAPRPIVYVFVDLVGLWYAAAEMPETFRVLVGVSAELFHAIDNERMQETGRSVSDACEVFHVRGRDVRIPLRGRTPVEEPSHAPDAYTETKFLTLTPEWIAPERPVDLRDVALRSAPEQGAE